MGGGPATARIEAFAVSSAGRAIGSSADAVAVFCKLAPTAEEPTRAVIVTTVAPPAASVPSRHVTVCPDALQLPWPAFADTNDSPLGSGSVIVTPVAGLGPWLTRLSV